MGLGYWRPLVLMSDLPGADPHAWGLLLPVGLGVEWRDHKRQGNASPLSSTTKSSALNAGRSGQM